jgi:hypothetical protein
LFSPSQLPGLAAWYDAADSSTVLTTVGPDVPATNGQTVRRWLSRHNPAVFFDQADLALQPVFTNSTTGLTFDGVNDFMGGTSTMAGIMRNRGYGYIFAVAQDTNPTGGDNLHLVSIFTTGTSATASRIFVSAKTSAAGVGATFRRLDTDSPSSPSAFTQNGNLNLIEARGNYQEGESLVFRNGNSFSVSLAGSGATSNTDSQGVFIGGGISATYFPGNIREVIIVNEQLTDAQILSTRRYLQRKWGTPALP